MRRQTAVDSHLGRILVFLSAGRRFVALEARQLQQSSHLCLALASRQSLDSTEHPLQIKMQPGCSASAWPQCSHFGSSGASSVAASTINPRRPEKTREDPWMMEKRSALGRETGTLTRVQTSYTL